MNARIVALVVLGLLIGSTGCPAAGGGPIEGVGTPGAPQGGVVTVQGASNGTPLPVAISSGTVSVQASSPLPVSLSTPVGVSAESSAAQWKSGSASVTDNVGLKLTDGPFVLTDATNVTTSSDTLTEDLALFTVDAAASCSARSTYLAMVFGHSRHGEGIHGARLFIPAGQSLCAALYIPGNRVLVSWSGFAPYP